ncbi:PEP-CTERM sorting domain-containing protein [Moorena sp. SIO3H5]|uniref:PEP-CTERM sorting domain-containing protein n=1 Tax=Moorena sp. SIO3H5 TaxID=2607834 RepID=UPI0013B62C07|nr:PEP-CTERM sorting domain-containing protein [Moorena sp. SIO3H5]NEO70909.1 PEP-CTERM sorting domain-containing protein [Moorena sp. SIO3H5]
MRNYPISLLLGLTATIALYAPLPAQAQPILYDETGGKESITLDPDGLAVLESIGLSVNIDSIEQTAEPAPGFSFAFSVLPRSSDPNVLGNSFQFLYDEETDFFLPFSGSTELSGSIFFDVDTTKIDLPPVFEIGDLSARFDPTTFEFSLTDTANTGLAIFDSQPPGNPVFDLPNQTWSLDPLLISISEDFSNFLIDAQVAAGVTDPIVTEGVLIAIARGDRTFVEAGSTQVPEPGSVFAVITAASAALAVGKRRRCA